MIVHTSFHNGSKVRRDHNIRNRKVTDKEAHIDPNGVHEIWHDETLEDAYQRIFGQAIEDYNSKQKHKSRRISKDYLGEIKADKSKHPVYECIVGIYPQDGETLTTDQSKEILKEFFDGWKESNPNMEIIGAYFHADEEGEPHIHIDYIPIGHYKQKAAVQNSLSRAFDEMGIKYRLADAENGVSAKTPQMIWQDKERDRLDSICTEKGYTVEHPVIEGEAEAREHENTRSYKNRKANEEAEIRLADITEQVSSLVEEKGFVENEIKGLEVIKAQDEKKGKELATAIQTGLKQEVDIKNRIEASKMAYEDFKKEQGEEMDEFFEYRSKKGKYDAELKRTESEIQYRENRINDLMQIEKDVKHNVNRQFEKMAEIDQVVKYIDDSRKIEEDEREGRIYERQMDIVWGVLGRFPKALEAVIYAFEKMGLLSANRKKMIHHANELDKLKHKAEALGVSIPQKTLSFTEEIEEEWERD